MITQIELAKGKQLDLLTTEAVNFGVAVEAEGDVLSAVVVGELDMATAPILMRAIQEHNGHHQSSVVNLAGLTFVDCAGLRALLAIRDDPSTRVSFEDPSRCVVRLFELLGLDDLLS